MKSLLFLSVALVNALLFAACAPAATPTPTAPAPTAIVLANTPTDTPVPSSTPTTTATATIVPSDTPTQTLTPTATATITPTATATKTPVPPTATLRPSTPISQLVWSLQDQDVCKGLGPAFCTDAASGLDVINLYPVQLVFAVPSHPPVTVSPNRDWGYPLAPGTYNWSAALADGRQARGTLTILPKGHLLFITFGK